jgi:hypothetical protein
MQLFFNCSYKSKLEPSVFDRLRPDNDRIQSKHIGVLKTKWYQTFIVQLMHVSYIKM